jgi:transcriptional regulator with XRE-family HTH domain
MLQLPKSAVFYSKSGDFMEVHEKIRYLRESKNWSQEEMAEKLNMSPSGYSKIERGETKAAIPKLIKIAEMLEVDLIELIPLDGKNVYLNNNYSNNGCHFNGSAELAFEIQKLQLHLELKGKELALQQREIENLKEIIALLKKEAV